MAETVAPDQGWDSYNQQIALHPLPSSTPAQPAAPQPTAPQPSGVVADSGVVVPNVMVPQPPSGTADAGALIAAQLQAPSIPLLGPAVSDSAAVTPVFPTSTISDSQGSTLVSLSSGSGYESYGWYIVPSASNQYGEGPGDGDFKIDFAGDIITEWYFV